MTRLGKSEFMRVDENFFHLVQQRVIRDQRERKYFKKYNPNIQVFSSCKHATRELANELKKRGW